MTRWLDEFPARTDWFDDKSEWTHGCIPVWDEPSGTFKPQQWFSETPKAVPDGVRYRLAGDGSGASEFMALEIGEREAHLDAGLKVTGATLRVEQPMNADLTVKMRDGATVFRSLTLTAGETTTGKVEFTRSLSTGLVLEITETGLLEADKPYPGAVLDVTVAAV